MELTMKFLAKEEWSIYATINATIILLLLILMKRPLNLQSLIMLSLLAMMKGDITARLIFTLFLSLLVFQKNKTWFINTCIYLFSSFVISLVPYNNYLQHAIESHLLLLWGFRLIILGWFFIYWKFDD